MEKDSSGVLGGNVVGAGAPVGKGTVRSDHYKGDTGAKAERVNNTPTGLGVCTPRVRYRAWPGRGGVEGRQRSGVPYGRLYHDKHGAVAQECSSTCVIWCKSSAVRIGRTEHSRRGRGWSGDQSPLLVSGGGGGTPGARQPADL